MVFQTSPFTLLTLFTWPILLKEFINDRTTEIHVRCLLCDWEHIRLAEKSRRAMDQLIVSLEPKQHRLFLEYESAENNLIDRKDEAIYRQGLIDGLEAWILN